MVKHIPAIEKRHKEDRVEERKAFLAHLEKLEDYQRQAAEKTEETASRSNVALMENTKIMAHVHQVLEKVNRKVD